MYLWCTWCIYVCVLGPSESQVRVETSVTQSCLSSTWPRAGRGNGCGGGAAQSYKIWELERIVVRRQSRRPVEKEWLRRQHGRVLASYFLSFLCAGAAALKSSSLLSVSLNVAICEHLPSYRLKKRHISKKMCPGSQKNLHEKLGRQEGEAERSGMKKVPWITNLWFFPDFPHLKYLLCIWVIIKIIWSSCWISWLSNLFSTHLPRCTLGP